MTLIEIKKVLYKTKPLAKFLHFRKAAKEGFLVYGCSLKGQALPDLFFEIPIDELSNGLYGNTLEAQLLIRYIIQPETTDHEAAI